MTLRILHVVTWDAPGNPFGGPLTVARNLAAEARRRGHTVTVISACPRGYPDRPNNSVERRFVGFRWIPGAGFSGLASPTLWYWVALKARSFDIVHVHICRDLVTLPAAAIALARNTKVVLQPHGMVDPSTRTAAVLLDALLTRRVFRRANVVLALTDPERRDIALATGRRVEEQRLQPNGVPSAASGQEPPELDPEFIFCSRLHVRKRPALFAEAAANLLADGVVARFTLVGPNEGEQELVDAIVRTADSAALRREDALDPVQVSDRLQRSAVVVLPSVNEPYPMIILEALSVGRPVIVSDTCGLASFVEEHQAGIVVKSDDLASLADAMRLLAERPILRHQMGVSGRQAVQSHLSMEAAMGLLERSYEVALRSP